MVFYVSKNFRTNHFRGKPHKTFGLVQISIFWGTKNVSSARLKPAEKCHFALLHACTLGGPLTGSGGV